MSEFMRCPTCRGKKVVMAKGMIIKKCEPCLGIGSIQAQPQQEKLPDEEYNKIIEDQNQKDFEAFKEKLVSAKRGRKPK